MMAGLVQDPKSRVARAFLVEAAALQAFSWVLQPLTVVPERLPELTASAQALFWIWYLLVKNKTSVLMTYGAGSLNGSAGIDKGVSVNTERAVAS